MSHKPILKVGNVSYINSLPFAYGFDHYKQEKVTFEVSSDNPYQLSLQLLENKIQVAILSAVLMFTNEHLVRVGDYCIASDCRVESVLICSDFGLKELDGLVLDNESRTSNLFAQVVLRQFYGLGVDVLQFLDLKDEKDRKLGFVKIGDKALQEDRYKFRYDLVEIWKAQTNLPFVFALWLAKEDNFSEEVKRTFSEALAYGTNNIPALLHQRPELDKYKEYLTRHIVYRMDDTKEEGLQLFRKLLFQEKLV